MDICSHIGFPVNDVNSLHGLSTNVLVGDFSVNELAYGVTTFLNIQDDVEGVSSSIPPKHVLQSKTINTESHENDDADLITGEVITHDGNAAKYINPHCSSAPSLPNPLKPVSAMKGSREKRGVTPPNKLTVKWAPDVYDPIPTSSEHLIINKPHKHGKKSKSKQKTGSKSTTSRGSKGKDKKQLRKRSGTGNSSSQVNTIHVSEIQIQPSAIDFHLGIPDLFCRGSFVNRYVSNLHLSSVTEAT